MPYDLEGLQNTKLSMVHASSDGDLFRKSWIIEKNASFLVMWAAELFGDWGTFMAHILPGCKAEYNANVC